MSQIISFPSGKVIKSKTAKHEGFVNPPRLKPLPLPGERSEREILESLLFPEGRQPHHEVGYDDMQKAMYGIYLALKDSFSK